MNRSRKLLNIFLNAILPVRVLSKRNKKILAVSSLGVILIMVPIITYSLLHLHSAEAAWFNTNWGFRKAIPVTSTEGAVQNNVFVSFTLDTATLIGNGKLQSNCQDIRVTDASGKLLKYHVGRATACNNASTSIDFLLSSFPDGQSTYYVYYGNPSAPTADAGSLTVSQANASTVTASGNEITDVTRATATQGDGLYPSATNLITNGGFETNTTGWSAQFGGESLSRVTSEHKFGTASIQVVVGTGNQGINTGFYIPGFSPSTTYTLSAWVKDTGAAMVLQVDEATSGYTYIQSQNTTVGSGTGSWRHIQYTFTTSPTTGRLQLDIYKGGTGATTFYIDGIQLETGSVATDYIETDGATASRFPDSSYGIWQGTTNLVTNGGLESNTTGWVAHGNAGISQSNTYSKFGSYSLKVICGDTGANGVRFPVSVSNSTTYSMGVWVYSPDSGNMDIAIWRNDFGANTGSSTVYVPANTWTRISGTGTTDGVSPWATLLVRNLNGAPRTFYVDGLQLETGSIATPYIETNGGTVARSSARVQGSSASLNSTQGWVAMRVKLYSSTNGYFFLFGADANNRINAWADFTYNRIYIEKIDGVANFSNTVTTGDLRNTTATIIVKWTKSRMDLSANGSAFSGFTTTATPITGTSFDIGSGGTIIPTSNFNGNVLWTITGTGTLTDTDASTLNGYGNTDPSTTQLAGLNGGIANPTLLWTADTTADTQTTYSQGPARNYIIGTLAVEENGAAPVLYLKFDEGTGIIANDSSSNKNNGTLTNSPTWQVENQCISGKCLYFDGSSNNYVDVGNNWNFATTDSFSVSAWFKTTSLAAEQAIIVKGQNALCFNYAYLLETNGSIQFGNTPGQDTIIPAGKISANTWYHFEAVYVNGSVTGYLNGIAYATVSRVTSTCANSIKIGSAGGGRLFKGFIDDVKIYKYARSISQIKTDYSSRGSVKGVSTSIGASNANQNLSNGLVGFWKMDEATWSGTLNEVVDSSGNGNNGQAQGATGGKAYPTNGKFGNGGFFDGVDDYVDLGSPASLQVAKFTVSAWFKTTVSGSQDIYRYGPYGINLGVTAVTGTAKKCAIQFYDSAANSYIANSSVDCNDGNWHLATGTYDGLSLSIYVDGKLENTVATTATVSYASSQVTIGRSGPYSVSYFNGNIDELRIYNRALSPAEVSQLYNYAPGPVTYYNFEEGQGSTINDISGNGNTGTWNGTGTTQWTQGKYGKAVKFNGTNNYISSTNNLSSLQKTATVSFWTKHTYVSSYNVGILAELSTNLNSNDAFGISFDDNSGGSVPTMGGFTITSHSAAGYNIYATNNRYDDGQWHYVTVILDRTQSTSASQIAIYVDGQLTPKTLVGSYNTLQNTSFGSFPIYLGARSGGSYGYDGVMDEFKLYNYALNAKQIISGMNGGHPSVGSPVGSALGYWKFDEGYGSTAHNSGSLGSAQDGAISGTQWMADGKFGKTLRFDGSISGNVVTVPTFTYESNQQYTLSFWAKYFGGQGDYLTKETFWNDGFKFYGSPSGLAFRAGDGTNAADLFGTNIGVANGTWFHLVMVRNGSLWSMYVNGKLKATATNTLIGDSNNSGSLRIGNRGNGDWPVHFQGQLDEVKIYNYALTPSEILLDYNHGSSMVLGSMSDTSGLTGGSVASNSASAAYCIPGDTSTCSSPVGEWNFEEGNGNTVNDSSGNGLIGTMTNGATWTSGKIGKAGNFNGVSVRQGVQVSNNALLNPGTGSFTTEAWIKTTQTGIIKRIVTKRGSSSTWYSMFINNGVLAFETAVSYPTYYTTGTGNKTVNDGQWHHVVMVRDTSQSKILLYVDGALDVNPTDNTAGQSIANSEIFEIGIWGTEVYDTGSYTGKIDQVRMFNYARTPAQIAWDYNRGAPIGYWKFDECQGTIAHDSSGNGNDGTITIGATAPQTTVGTCLTPTDGSGAWYNGASGKFNASLKFDGADDYVNVPNFSALNPGNNDFSISFWIKTSSPGDIIQTSNNNAGAFTQGYGVVIAGWTCSNNKLYFNMANGTTKDTEMCSNTVMTDGNWHHAVIAVTRGSTIKMYIDGKLDKSQNTSLTGSITNNRFQIAASTWWSYLNGQLDDIRIYNYALTSLQIKQVYNQGAGVRFGPLTGSP